MKEEEYDELFEQWYDDVDEPQDKLAGLEKLIALADENKDFEISFEHRLYLISRSAHFGFYKGGIAAAKWCIAHIQNSPSKINPTELLDSLNGILDTLPMFSEISKPEILQIQDQFAEIAGRKKRFVRNIHRIRALNHCRMGDLQAAAESEKQYLKIPLDDYYDFPTYDIEQQTLLKCAERADEAALETAQPILQKEHTCWRYAYEIWGAVTRSMLRLGKKSEAMAVVELAYPRVNQIPISRAVGELSLAAVACDKLDWALESLKAGLDSPVLLDNCESQFRFCSALECLMRRLAGEVQDPIDLTISAALAGELVGDKHTADTLANHFGQIAETIGKRFDERNDNTVYLDILAENRQLCSV